MAFNFEKLQKLADDMATPCFDGSLLVWILNEKLVPEWFKLITPYIRKATYRSDWSDPDDAFGQVVFEVWKAFQMYGPRPNGGQFSDLIKLKTNNVLTNRAKRRGSDKCRLNYEAESYESLLDVAGDSPFLGVAITHFLTLESDEGLYNECMEERVQNMTIGKYREAETFEEGDNCVTRHGKIVKILLNAGRRNSVKVYVSATEKSVDVPLDYQLAPYSLSSPSEVEGKKVKLAEVEEPEVTEDAIIEIVEEPEEPEEEKLTVTVVEVLQDTQIEPEEEMVEETVEETVEPVAESTPEAKPKKKKSSRKSAKKVAFEMLLSGPQTRDSIATALMELRKKSGSGVQDMEKLKTYASVTLSTIARDLRESEEYEYRKVERKTYQIFKK